MLFKVGLSARSYHLLIFISVGVFVLKSIVKILIKPPIKFFLSLLSPIHSLNLSKIG